MPTARKLTKAQTIARLAEKTGLTQVQVKSVFEALEHLTKSELKRAGQFGIVPGLLTVRVDNKPARPARQGFRPGTREPMMFKAKPASKTVKARVGKSLKDLV